MDESIQNSANQFSQLLYSQLTQEERAISGYMCNLIKSARQHLQMEVAFISEFLSGRRFFRYVDARKDVNIIKVGDSDPLNESYCQRVVDGRLPELITDARTIPAVADLSVTQALPVGGHVSVPIRLSNGRIYGTFCAFSREAKPDLNANELAIMRVFADIAAALIEGNIDSFDGVRAVRNRIQRALDNDELALYGQPIMNLNAEGIVGFELLARVTSDLAWAPNLLFDDANRVGLSNAVSNRTISKGLEMLQSFPEHIFVALNLAPEAILECDFEKLFDHVPLDRLVLEITEHSIINDYQRLISRLAPLRQRGARLAVDDAGAGYASLRHILRLSPDIIKLDISLIQNIHGDKGLQALAAALIEFAHRQNCMLVAEGIEHENELATLRELGVSFGQGYFFSRPKQLHHCLEDLKAGTQCMRVLCSDERRI